MSSKTNRRQWPIVKFGDVVKNSNLVESSPVDNGIKRIVGLEHLDPENLHIRRWNLPENGTSFTRKFVPGQTLFGKRRAYQKKVAYAEFEGICSGDILTFESKDKKILLPELLPFICQSDAFFDYALGTSAGSLSPRTSWKALKEFEFPLPPIAEQKRIAEILWAADEVMGLYDHSLQNLIQIRNKYFIDNCFLGHTQNELRKITSVGNGWYVKKITELFQLRKKKSSPPHQKAEYIGLEHFDSGSFQMMDKGESSVVKSTCNVYSSGDFLYGKLRPNLDKAVKVDSTGVCSTEILVLQNNGEIFDELFIHHLHCKKFINWNSHRAFGTRMPRTSMDILDNYRIPVPPKNEQSRIAGQLKHMLGVENQTREHIKSLKLLQSHYAKRLLENIE